MLHLSLSHLAQQQGTARDDYDAVPLDAESQRVPLPIESLLPPPVERCGLHRREFLNETGNTWQDCPVCRQEMTAAAVSRYAAQEPALYALPAFLTPRKALQEVDVPQKPTEWHPGSILIACCVTGMVLGLAAVAWQIWRG